MKINPALLAPALILSLAALPSSRGECHLSCNELEKVRQALASRVFPKGNQHPGTRFLAKETTTLAQVLRRESKGPNQQGVG